MPPTVPSWDEFYAALMGVYWPCLPPEEREAYGTRPRQDGEEAAVPDDVWRAALLIFPDPEAWLANPIPNAGRRTPLQLLAAGEGDRLRAILQEVGPMMLPDPSEVRPWTEDGTA